MDNFRSTWTQNQCFGFISFTQVARQCFRLSEELHTALYEGRTAHFFENGFVQQNFKNSLEEYTVIYVDVGCFPLGSKAKNPSILERCEEKLEQIYNHRLNGQACFFPDPPSHQSFFGHPKSILRHHARLEFLGVSTRDLWMVLNDDGGLGCEIDTSKIEGLGDSHRSDQNDEALPRSQISLSGKDGETSRRSRGSSPESVRTDRSMSNEQITSKREERSSRVRSRSRDKAHSRGGRKERRSSRDRHRSRSRTRRRSRSAGGQERSNNDFKDRSSASSRRSGVSDKSRRRVSRESSSPEDEPGPHKKIDPSVVTKNKEFQTLASKWKQVNSNEKGKSLSSVRLSSRLEDTKHRRSNPVVTMSFGLKKKDSKQIETGKSSKHEAPPTKSKSQDKTVSTSTKTAEKSFASKKEKISKKSDVEEVPTVATPALVGVPLANLTTDSVLTPTIQYPPKMTELGAQDPLPIPAPQLPVSLDPRILSNPPPHIAGLQQFNPTFNPPGAAPHPLMVNPYSPHALQPYYNNGLFGMQPDFQHGVHPNYPMGPTVMQMGHPGFSVPPHFGIPPPQPVRPPGNFHAPRMGFQTNTPPPYHVQQIPPPTLQGMQCPPPNFAVMPPNEPSHLITAPPKPVKPLKDTPVPLQSATLNAKPNVLTAIDRKQQPPKLPNVFPDSTSLPISNFEKIQFCRFLIQNLQDASNLLEKKQQVSQSPSLHPQHAIKGNLLCVMKEFSDPPELCIILPEEEHIRRNIITAIFIKYPAWDFDAFLELFEQSFYNIPIEDIEESYEKFQLLKRAAGTTECTDGVISSTCRATLEENAPLKSIGKEDFVSEKLKRSLEQDDKEEEVLLKKKKKEEDQPVLSETKITLQDFLHHSKQIEEVKPAHKLLIESTSTAFTAGPSKVTLVQTDEVAQPAAYEVSVTTEHKVKELEPSRDISASSERQLAHQVSGTLEKDVGHVPDEEVKSISLEEKVSESTKGDLVEIASDKVDVEQVAPCKVDLTEISPREVEEAQPTPCQVEVTQIAPCQVEEVQITPDDDAGTQVASCNNEVSPPHEMTQSITVQHAPNLTERAVVRPDPSEEKVSEPTGASKSVCASEETLKLISSQPPICSSDTVSASSKDNVPQPLSAEEVSAPPKSEAASVGAEEKVSSPSKDVVAQAAPAQELSEAASISTDEKVSSPSKEVVTQASPAQELSEAASISTDEKVSLLSKDVVAQAAPAQELSEAASISTDEKVSSPSKEVVTQAAPAHELSEAASISTDEKATLPLINVVGQAAPAEEVSAPPQSEAPPISADEKVFSPSKEVVTQAVPAEEEPAPPETSVTPIDLCEEEVGIGHSVSSGEVLALPTSEAAPFDSCEMVNKSLKDEVAHPGPSGVSPDVSVDEPVVTEENIPKLVPPHDDSSAHSPIDPCQNVSGSLKDEVTKPVPTLEEVSAPPESEVTPIVPCEVPSTTPIGVETCCVIEQKSFASTADFLDSSKDVTASPDHKVEQLASPSQQLSAFPECITKQFVPLDNNVLPASSECQVEHSEVPSAKDDTRKPTTVECKHVTEKEALSSQENLVLHHTVPHTPSEGKVLPASLGNTLERRAKLESQEALPDSENEVLLRSLEVELKDLATDVDGTVQAAQPKDNEVATSMENVEIQLTSSGDDQLEKRVMPTLSKGSYTPLASQVEHPVEGFASHRKDEFEEALRNAETCIEDPAARERATKKFSSPEEKFQSLATSDSLLPTLSQDEQLPMAPTTVDIVDESKVKLSPDGSENRKDTTLLVDTIKTEDVISSQDTQGFVHTEHIAKNNTAAELIDNKKLSSSQVSSGLGNSHVLETFQMAETPLPLGQPESMIQDSCNFSNENDKVNNDDSTHIDESPIETRASTVQSSEARVFGETVVSSAFEVSKDEPMDVNEYWKEELSGVKPDQSIVALQPQLNSGAVCKGDASTAPTDDEKGKQNDSVGEWPDVRDCVASYSQGPQIYVEPDNFHIFNYKKLKLFFDKLFELQEHSFGLIINKMKLTEIDCEKDKFMLKRNLLCIKQTNAQNTLLVVVMKTPKVYCNIVNIAYECMPELPLDKFKLIIDHSIYYVTLKEIESLDQSLDDKLQLQAANDKKNASIRNYNTLSFLREILEDIHVVSDELCSVYRHLLHSKHGVIDSLVLKNGLICSYSTDKDGPCLKICLPQNVKFQIFIVCVLHDTYHGLNADCLTTILTSSFDNVDLSLVNDVISNCHVCNGFQRLVGLEAPEDEVEKESTPLDERGVENASAEPTHSNDHDSNAKSDVKALAGTEMDCTSPDELETPPLLPSSFPPELIEGIRIYQRSSNIYRSQIELLEKGQRRPGSRYILQNSILFKRDCVGTESQTAYKMVIAPSSAKELLQQLHSEFYHNLSQLELTEFVEQFLTVPKDSIQEIFQNCHLCQLVAPSGPDSSEQEQTESSAQITESQVDEERKDEELQPLQPTSGPEDSPINSIERLLGETLKDVKQKLRIWQRNCKAYSKKIAKLESLETADNCTLVDGVLTSVKYEQGAPKATICVRRMHRVNMKLVDILHSTFHTWSRTSLYRFITQWFDANVNKTFLSSRFRNCERCKASCSEESSMTDEMGWGPQLKPPFSDERPELAPSRMTVVNERHSEARVKIEQKQDAIASKSALVEVPTNDASTDSFKSVIKAVRNLVPHIIDWQTSSPFVSYVVKKSKLSGNYPRRFAVADGILFKKTGKQKLPKIVLTAVPNIRKNLIHQFHSNYHSLSSNEIWKRIKSTFDTGAMTPSFVRNVISTYCETCDQCEAERKKSSQNDKKSKNGRSNKKKSALNDDSRKAIDNKDGCKTDRKPVLKCSKNEGVARAIVENVASSVVTSKPVGESNFPTPETKSVSRNELKPLLTEAELLQLAPKGKGIVKQQYSQVKDDNPSPTPEHTQIVESDRSPSSNSKIILEPAVSQVDLTNDGIAGFSHVIGNENGSQTDRCKPVNEGVSTDSAKVITENEASLAVLETNLQTPENTRSQSDHVISEQAVDNPSECTQILESDQTENSDSKIILEPSVSQVDRINVTVCQHVTNQEDIADTTNVSFESDDLLPSKAVTLLERLCDECIEEHSNPSPVPVERRNMSTEGCEADASMDSPSSSPSKASVENTSCKRPTQPDGSPPSSTTTVDVVSNRIEVSTDSSPSCTPEETTLSSGPPPSLSESDTKSDERGRVLRKRSSQLNYSESGADVSNPTPSKRLPKRKTAVNSPRKVKKARN